MRWRPLTWLLLSVMFFVAALYFWRLGDEWAEKKKNQKPELRGQKSEDQGQKPEPTAGTNGQKSEVHGQRGAIGGNLNKPPPVAPSTNHASRITQPESPLAHRLSNTARPMKELARRDHAILLENALLDTEKGNSLAIPDFLRAQGDPGTYITQSHKALDGAFRAM